MHSHQSPTGAGYTRPNERPPTTLQRLEGLGNVHGEDQEPVDDTARYTPAQAREDRIAAIFQPASKPEPSAAQLDFVREAWQTNHVHATDLTLAADAVVRNHNEARGRVEDFGDVRTRELFAVPHDIAPRALLSFRSRKLNQEQRVAVGGIARWASAWIYFLDDATPERYEMPLRIMMVDQIRSVRWCTGTPGNKANTGIVLPATWSELIALTDVTPRDLGDELDRARARREVRQACRELVLACYVVAVRAVVGERGKAEQ